ncbi:globin domain-containing protein [Actinomadura macrotermitis]|uniref:nitric oxide dioxygenase n=1 Tax=Actinomadura macrotermitis TaxID=2585200 RepID=A0A7K0C6L8_9ACTN|nr:globin domain-containing protein [Actinomadura macrotermitis]MQY09111.1 Flavohemoprotein [Actinomadura macrotermitis]
MSLEPRIIKETFSRLELSGDKAAAYFYGRLFAENPRLRALFPPAMDMQRDRLFQALTTIVFSLDNPMTLDSYLARLGRDHRKFGVRREHYPAVGSALLATLRRFAGDGWSPEAEAAWAAAYARAAATMMEAAERDAEQNPPWWVAEVVDHDRRGPDLAVLTLRPGRPLPFAAGQYVTVQTARWPRVWRPYSVANAPRADGLLRLQVRAVPGGWVSGALVRHTAAGDSLLLGPALGAMTLDADSGRDLLLVAGGTGLAPLKAVAEQAIGSGRRRDVHLLVGARTERDLYDLPGLRLLESTCPWLRVTPVVSDDPGFDGMRGTLPEVLDRLHDLEDRDVYVSGPAGMTRRAVSVLQRLGVPLDRLHHDLLETEGVPVPAAPGTGPESVSETGSGTGRVPVPARRGCPAAG